MTTPREALLKRASVRITQALDRLRDQAHPSVSCSFCDNKAVASYQVREGTIPRPYEEIDPQKNPDKSHLRVVRVCEKHKNQVPR